MSSSCRNRRWSARARRARRVDAERVGLVVDIEVCCWQTSWSAGWPPLILTTMCCGLSQWNLNQPPIMLSQSGQLPRPLSRPGVPNVPASPPSPPARSVRSRTPPGRLCRHRRHRVACTRAASRPPCSPSSAPCRSPAAPPGRGPMTSAGSPTPACLRLRWRCRDRHRDRRPQPRRSGTASIRSPPSHRICPRRPCHCERTRRTRRGEHRSPLCLPLCPGSSRSCSTGRSPPSYCFKFSVVKMGRMP